MERDDHALPELAFLIGVIVTGAWLIGQLLGA